MAELLLLREPGDATPSGIVAGYAGVDRPGPPGGVSWEALQGWPDRLYGWYMTSRMGCAFEDALPRVLGLKEFYGRNGLHLQVCVVAGLGEEVVHSAALLGFDIASGPNGLSLLGWGLVPHGEIAPQAAAFFGHYRRQLNGNGLFCQGDAATECLRAANELQVQGCFEFEGTLPSEAFQVYAVSLLE